MTHLTGITTELMVDDMEKSIDFYKHTLGFKIILSEPKTNPFFVILQNGKVKLMLYQRKQFAEEIPSFEKLPVGGSIALYIGVEDIASFFDKIKRKVKIIQPLHKTDYGSTEFSCEDCNGYLLMFHEGN